VSRASRPASFFWLVPRGVGPARWDPTGSSNQVQAISWPLSLLTCIERVRFSSDSARTLHFDIEDYFFSRSIDLNLEAVDSTSEMLC